MALVRAPHAVRARAAPRTRSARTRAEQGGGDHMVDRTVVVAGVGMIPFCKPGTSPPYHEMGAQAVTLALEDAGIAYDAIEQAYASYVYGDSTSGQRALYDV